MLYAVIQGESAIGTTRLEGMDPSMGVAFGAFTPTPEFERVRDVFALFDQAMGKEAASETERLPPAYYAARDALGLTLATQEGDTIPTSWIHISNVEPGMYEVGAQIPDAAFFDKVRP